MHVSKDDLNIIADACAILRRFNVLDGYGYAHRPWLKPAIDALENFLIKYGYYAPNAKSRAVGPSLRA